MASIVFLQFVPEIVDWLIRFRAFQRMVSQMFSMNFIVIVHIPAKQYAFSYETWQATKVKAKPTFGSKSTMARGSTEKDFNTQVIILWAASWQTPFLCHMRTSEQQRRISACVDASLLFVPTNRQSNNIHIFTTLFPFYELYFFSAFILHNRGPPFAIGTLFLEKRGWIVEQHTWCSGSCSIGKPVSDGSLVPVTVTSLRH